MAHKTAYKPSTHSPITSPLSDSERDVTGKALQGTLVDLTDLHLLAKQAHWNVVGPFFRDVHLHLDEIVHTAREESDHVAERAAAIGVSPDARAATVSETSGAPDFPGGWRSDHEVTIAIVNTLATLIQRMRPRIDETDKSDLVTQDLLIGITRKLEEAHWMWQAKMSSGDFGSSSG